MNQVRRRWTSQRGRTPMDPQAMAQVAGAEDDFAELAVLRLELSEQRREIAEATRWLDADERELLALWWLEASGHLTRSELADGLGVSAPHAAVRVQRMKKQLATCRAVVRVVSGRRCAALVPVLDGWDGRPSRCGASGSPSTSEDAANAPTGTATSPRPRRCWRDSSWSRCPPTPRCTPR